MHDTMRTTIANRLKALLLAACLLALAICLSACSGQNAAADNDSSTQAGDERTVAVDTLDANGTWTTIDVPFDPQRIAVLDMSALDIIDSLGMGERVVGVALASSAGTSIDYLDRYAGGDIVNLGTIKTPDLEAIMACEPDIIFAGSRLSSYYDQLNEIAPCVQIAVDTEKGVLESTVSNVESISSLFGLEDEAASKIENLREKIAELQAKVQGNTALVTLFTSGSISVLGDDGRCSLIGREIGFENLANGEVTSTHGNEISFETLAEKNPDYIFVLNRDAAIGADGADLAQEIIENDLVKNTDAYKNGRIAYLSSPSVWYTAEGGLTALETMLADIERVLA